MVTSEHEVTIPLDQGETLTIGHTALIVRRACGELVLQTPIAEITQVHRGGRDLVVTRRASDPLYLTAATLAAAQSVIEFMHSLLPTRRRSRRPWLPEGRGRADT